MPKTCRHIVGTLTAVAKAFSVSDSAVQKWARAGMPGRPGRYDVAHIGVWLYARRHALEGPDGGPPIRTWGDELRREMVLQRRRDVIGKDEAAATLERECCARSAWFVDSLNAFVYHLPAELAMKSTPECRAILEAAADKIRGVGYGDVGDLEDEALRGKREPGEGASNL